MKLKKSSNRIEHNYQNKSKLTLMLLTIGLFLLFLSGNNSPLLSSVGEVSAMPDMQIDSPLEDARPVKMSYQPPVDASTLAEIAPPSATQVSISFEDKDSQAGESNVDSLELSQTLATAVNPTLDTAVSIQDGLLGVIVEKNTFTQPVMLTFTPTWVSALKEPAVLNAEELPPEVMIRREEEKLFQFQIEMAAGGRTLTQFEKPVRLVVDLRAFGYDLSETGGKFFLAYRDEDNPNEWIEVPVTTHQSDGLISAEVMHFSDWTTGWRPEAWAPQWRLPTVSEFTGAATFQYPFELPPGRSGLQPTLGLSYSSSALNGAIRDVSLGRIATGWSINEVSIVRTGIKFSGVFLAYPDTFRLVLNGVGYELTKDVNAAGNVQRFYAKDMPSLRILSYDGRNYNNNNGGYWIVETGDGTHYRLGYMSHTKTLQNQELNCNQHQQRNCTGDMEVTAWHLDTVTDRHGNQMTYHYSNSYVSNPYDDPHTEFEEVLFFCPWGGFCSHYSKTFVSLLVAIRYNFPDRITNVDTGPVPPTAPQLTTTPATIISIAYDSESYLETITVQHGGQ